MLNSEFAGARKLRDAFILDQTNLGPIYWYHTGRTAAVVFSVDGERIVLNGTFALLHLPDKIIWASKPNHILHMVSIGI